MPVELIQTEGDLTLAERKGNGKAIEQMVETIRSLWRRLEAFVEASDAGLELADVIPDDRRIVAVVIRVPDMPTASMEHLAQSAATIAAKFGPGVFATIATNDAKIETLDEKYMREHGWVRAPRSEPGTTKGETDA